jgi:hypothetical protein
MRTQLRQSLSDVVSIAVDRTSEFIKSAQAELDKAGADSSDLLQRLSSIPLKFDEQGEPRWQTAPLTALPQRVLLQITSIAGVFHTFDKHKGPERGSSVVFALSMRPPAA